MKVTKAIETITSIKHVCRGLLPPDEQAALSLGIEALKAIRDVRPDSHYIAIELLPGETPEEEGKS